MRKTFLILFIAAIFASVQFILSGCDAGGNSVAVSTSSPSLVSPPDNDTIVSLTPTFKWSGSADKLEIGTTPSFQTIVQSVTLQTTDSTYTLPTGVLHNGTYYYWHAGRNSNGTEYWSSVSYSFKTVP